MKDNDEPAFPFESEQHPGMGLRDYFAAKAIQGFLANPQQDYAPLIDENVPMLAREAYRIADAMLAERAKP